MELKHLEIFSLANKVAVITGAGDGIGLGIAVEMAKAGAHIVCAELDPEKAEGALEQITKHGARALQVVGDVTKQDHIDNMFQEALKAFGTVDILVNNVGGILGVRGGLPFLEMSEDFWTRIMDVNLKSTFLCTKSFAKVLVAQKKGGNVINLSSLADRAPWLPVLIYGSAKAGISNFTTTVAVELGKYNIRVNAICPGTIETPLVAQLYEDMPEVKRARVKSIPAGRLGQPEDVGRVAVFLASDAASYVSGATIVVSGGLTSFL